MKYILPRLKLNFKNIFKDSSFDFDFGEDDQHSCHDDSFFSNQTLPIFEK